MTADVAQPAASSRHEHRISAHHHEQYRRRHSPRELKNGVPTKTGSAESTFVMEASMTGTTVFRVGFMADAPRSLDSAGHQRERYRPPDRGGA